MTPAQKEAFLQTHPKARERVQQQWLEALQKYEKLTPAQKQQFARRHPETAHRLATAGPKEPGHPRVSDPNRREGSQQSRINQGIGSGALTAEQEAQAQRSGTRVQELEAVDPAGRDAD